MGSQIVGLEGAFRKTERFLSAVRIRHLYIGGIAVMASGEPRMTIDVDLIVFLAEDQVGRLLDGAVRRGFRVHRNIALVDARERGAFRIAYGPVYIDFIVASTALEESAWKRRKRRVLFGLPVRVPSVEDLILLKLIPGRPRDLLDAEGLVTSAGSRLDRRYLRTWARRLADEAEDFAVVRRLRDLGIE